MRKTIFIVFMFMLCLFSTACSANNTNAIVESDLPIVTSQTAPNPPSQSTPSAQPGTPTEEEPESALEPTPESEPIPTQESRLAEQFVRGVSAVAAGQYSSFAVQPDGSLWGWGLYGVVEWGENLPPHIPRPLPEKIMDDVASVSAGGWSDSPVMVIKNDCSLWAFGNNTHGQLGDGTTTSRNEPIKIMDNVAAVSVGGFHTMAIKADGSLWTWGGGWHGQLGDGAITDRYTPAKIMDDVMAISAGSSHSMAITSDGVLWGWGHNGTGRLGYADTADELNPIHPSPIKIMDDAIWVSAGFDHTLVIKGDGSLWAFGNNAVGKLGVGPPMIPPESPYHLTPSPSPVPMKVMDEVVAVSAGDSYSMAITSDGMLWGWGLNEGLALLGLGDVGSEMGTVASPMMIMGNVASVSAWNGHTLVAWFDGSVWAFGDNQYAQIGDGGEYGFLEEGGSENRNIPTLVYFPANG